MNLVWLLLVPKDVVGIVDSVLRLQGASATLLPCCEVVPVPAPLLTVAMATDRLHMIDDIFYDGTHSVDGIII